MTAAQQKFITEVAAAVKKYAPSYGILVYSPIIAQAICESNWGKSTLSAKYHNYFGLKCGSSWTGKSVNMSTGEEYTVGTITKISANFRVYDSLEAGIKGYFDFIGGYSRYSNLKGITDPLKYLQTIKADGYATSSTYVNTNYKLVTTYNLTQYDPRSTSTTTTSKTSTTTTVRNLKKGMKGDDVKELQQALLDHKFKTCVINGVTKKLTVDGDFGAITESILKRYQTYSGKGLKADGICGPLTRKALGI